MRKNYFFSRVAVLLLTAMMTIPMYADEKLDLNISTNVNSPHTGSMGMTEQFLVYVTDDAFNTIPELSLSYTSSNTDVATIANAQWNGNFLWYEFDVVPGQEYGETTITVSFAGDETYKAASTSFIYKLEAPTPPIVEKQDIQLSHFEDMEFNVWPSDLYAQKDMHWQYEGFIGGNIYIRAVDPATGARINRAIQCRVVSSDTTVFRIESNQPSIINVHAAGGYGDATITAYFDGDDYFNAAENSISFTVHVTECRFTYVADFRDEAGNILRSISMQEGDWMPNPTLYIHRPGSQGRLHDVAQDWTTAKQRVAWLMKDGELTDQLYAIAAGDDYIVVTYDLYEDGNDTTVRLPVHITPLIAPVPASESTDITDQIVFTGSEVDTYEGGVIHINTVLTEEQVCEALTDKAIGSDEWLASYRGMIAFNLPAGEGTLIVRTKIQAGYRLGWAGRNNNLIQDITTDGDDEGFITYRIRYSAPELVGFVLFIVAEPSNAPMAKKAYAMTGDAEPIAIIEQIAVEPYSAPTAIQTPNAEKSQNGHVRSTKVMENGHLFIQYKGTKYNVSGQTAE